MIPDFTHCIKCTICVENCPVYQVNPLYPGPKQAGPDAVRFRLSGGEEYDSWVEYCTQCGRCTAACPHDVGPSKLILSAQQDYAEQHGRTLPVKLFARNYYLGRLATSFGPIANFITRMRPVKWLFRKLGFSSYIPFPTFRFKTLQRANGKRSASRTGSTPERKVALFHGCYMNNNDPEVGRRIVSILRELGVHVVVPEQTCCGLAATGNADLESARKYAKKNGEILGDLVARGYDIVYSCTSCGHTLIHDYPDRLQAPNGSRISRACWDVHEYLLEMMDEILPRLGRVNRRIAYHIPCHLRHAAMGYPAAEILRHVPGLELIVTDRHCCGMSGSYGFKAKNQETALELGRRASRAILNSHPDVMMSDCGACRMQLGHLTRLDAVDPVDILAESLGMARYYGDARRTNNGG